MAQDVPRQRSRMANVCGFGRLLLAGGTSDTPAFAKTRQLMCNITYLGPHTSTSAATQNTKRSNNHYYPTSPQSFISRLLDTLLLATMLSMLLSNATVGKVLRLMPRRRGNAALKECNVLFSANSLMSTMSVILRGSWAPHTIH
jgi:hypothetical protein